jgi:aryl-alcohol dehydrogenase-like predicted oxidoreductase
MDKRELGNTGIYVSPLGLGTVKFGRNVGVKYPASFKIPGEAELADLLALSKDLGINTLDTAPAYGTSEERLGRLLNKDRKDWVIVGKAGEEFQNGISSHDFTPEHFERSLQRSLKNLQTDYLDILLIHSNGADMNILSNEALIEKMQDFKTRGLVRAVGASTKTVEGGIMTLELLDIVMASYTPDYTDEKPVLDYAAKNGKGLLLKKALSSGHAPDIRAAMNFAFAHPGVSSVITGTINPAHLQENVTAVNAALKLRAA